MKKILLITLFAILQTNSFAARSCSKNYGGSNYINSNGASVEKTANGCRIYNASESSSVGIPYQYDVTQCTWRCSWYGGGGYRDAARIDYTCCTEACLLDSVSGCANGEVWNSATCQCDPPPPPPCEEKEVCITYWNDGNGGADPLRPNEIPVINPNYSGQGYYAMRLFDVDSCTNPPTITLKMDVPGTCEEHGYCPQGETSCSNPKSSSSAGSSSSSLPDCVCMGCFGGSCLVTCSDGSNRTCVGDFENCTELKNSPEWTQCTAPGSSPSGGSSSGGGGSSASPSSQQNAVDGINALIDTLHHSNELQERGHEIIKDGQEQNKNFFDNALGFMGGLLEQVTGIFSNTNKIVQNTDNINKGVSNIANKLDSIKNRPRDTTIVNVGGDTINITGDTNIINIPIDSSIGEPWDTSGGMVGMLTGAFDSTFTGLDTLPNWDTIHRGTTDSIGGSIVATFDSGAGKFYKDTLNGWINNGLQNSVLSGQGSNNCPSFLMTSYPLTIGSITFDLTQNVKLGQYLCQPVIGGRSGWDIGRTILRIIVSIGCMFFLFKCATGTIGGDE